MVYLGIDPGPEESAYVVWDGESILEYGNKENRELLYWLKSCYFRDDILAPSSGFVAIEQIRGFGIPAGNALFDSCVWTGRFLQEWGEENCKLVPRKTITAHLCGTARAGDKFVREALIERLGPPGTKRVPGPTYGMSGHLWAALAVAITAMDQAGTTGAKGGA